MNPLLVYLYDANPIDVRDRRTQLAEQLSRAEAGAKWLVMDTASRNVLLRSMARDSEKRPRRESVALLDLRGETGDLEQLGFNVCETIVRHPVLRGVTRPMIWTDNHTVANLAYAQRVGAVAVIDDEWVYRKSDAPLAEVLAWASNLPPAPSKAIGATTRVFSAYRGSLEMENRERNDRFKRWFNFTPSDVHFALLWGMADAVELKFLISYVFEAGFATSERAARAQLERLQAEMSKQVEAFDGPEPARAEIARRFLAEMAPPQPRAFAELAWPKPTRIIELLSRPDVITWAYLGPGDEGVLRGFANLYDPPAGPAAKRHAAFKTAIRELADKIGEPYLSVYDRVHRSACALEDAFCDWRDHGSPEPLS